MDIQNVARNLVTHDGIFAAVVSSDENHTFAAGEQTKIQSLCSSMLAVHRSQGLTGMTRMMLSESTLGAISVVTNTVDGVLVSVAVQSGHVICKSLQRMITRAVQRGNKVRTAGQPEAEAVP